MFRAGIAILWVSFALVAQHAYSQATAPAPRRPPQSMPETRPPEDNWTAQASAPGGDTASGATSVVSVQLEALKQVLGMAMSGDEVKKIVDFENDKFGEDYPAILSHRRGVLIALMARLKENCR
jgi:hypothetical protein